MRLKFKSLGIRLPGFFLNQVELSGLREECFQQIFTDFFGWITFLVILFYHLKHLKASTP